MRLHIAPALRSQCRPPPVSYGQDVVRVLQRLDAAGAVVHIPQPNLVGGAIDGVWKGKGVRL